MKPLDVIIKRNFLNVMVTGHRDDRVLEQYRKPIQDKLNDVLDQIGSFARKKARELNLWTGLSGGTDYYARTWAYEHGQQCYCVAPIMPDQGNNGHDDRPNEHYIIVEHTRCNADGTVTDDRSVHISDEFKISKADVVVVVWDGQKARGAMGGTVRNLAEALRRSLPVIWIGWDEDKGVFTRVATPFSQESQVRLSLIDPLTPTTMTCLFAEHDSRDIKTLLVDLWEFFDDFDDHVNKLLSSAVDPGSTKTLTGFWHSFFFGLFGRWKIHAFKPISAYFGLKPMDELDKDLHTVTTFEALDRAAVYASSQYRDAAVFVYLTSSFAVFASAAAGVAWLGLDSFGWNILELIFLTIILSLVCIHRENQRAKDNKKKSSVHDRWIFTRQAAELLRMSYLLYPYLASVPHMVKDLWVHSAKRPILTAPARWFVLQHMRDLPVWPDKYVLESKYKNSWKDWIEQLKQFVDGQIRYHRHTKDKYGDVLRLQSLPILIYVMTIFVVGLQLFEFFIGSFWGLEGTVLGFIHWLADQDWMQLLATFSPAFAVALHGILTTFEAKHLANQSETMTIQLESIQSFLKKEFPEDGSFKPTLDNLVVTRQAAIHLVEVMFNEHQDWFEVVQEQEIEAPT